MMDKTPEDSGNNNKMHEAPVKGVTDRVLVESGTDKMLVDSGADDSHLKDSGIGLVKRTREVNNTGRADALEALAL